METCGEAREGETSDLKADRQSQNQVARTAGGSGYAGAEEHGKAGKAGKLKTVATSCVDWEELHTRTVPVCGTVWAHLGRTVWVLTMSITDGGGSAVGSVGVVAGCGARLVSVLFWHAGWVGISGLL